MAPQAKLKFYVWFDYYASYFSDRAQQCPDEIEAYHNATGACSAVIDCIVKDTDESVKSNMQSASITLGLMPVVLPFLAPSMSEIATLAQSWPSFCVIASLATPAASITSLRAANNVTELESPKPAVLKWIERFLKKQVNRWKGSLYIAKALTYGFALAAVANLVEVSFRTDIRTASGFRCGQNMMPLIWAELSTGCYLMAALAVRWRALRAHEQDEARLNARVAQAEMLWTVGVVAAEGQLLFGIIVFSSLIFISIVDAILVFLRYAASCVLCRVVVTVAIALARLEQDTSSENSSLVTEEASAADGEASSGFEAHPEASYEMRLLRGVGRGSR